MNEATKHRLLVVLFWAGELAGFGLLVTWAALGFPA